VPARALWIGVCPCRERPERVTLRAVDGQLKGEPGAGFEMPPGARGRGRVFTVQVRGRKTEILGN